MTIHRGHLFHLTGRPTVSDSQAALQSVPDGALAVGDDGRIRYSGPFADLPSELAGAEVVDHRPGYLLPGFIDTHVHFPQTYSGDSYGGGQLLEWLNSCIFPAESRFADPEFARAAAVDFCDRRIAAGTTAAVVFGSAFPHAQDALFAETQRFWLCRLPAVERLRIIWIQQFYHDQGQVRWRRPVDQPPVNQRLHSPYDPDARYAKKRDTSWIGYKVHLTETCEADRPNLITDVQTTAAATPDGAVTATVQSALAARGLLPETHVVDAGYVDAALLVASQVDHAIDLLGPVALDHGWRAHSEQGFDLSAFTIVWPDRVAHCPAGQTSRDWSETCDKRGTPLVHITFAPTTCAACPNRPLCTPSPPGKRSRPRSLVVRPNLSMKLCRRGASSRRARSGRNDIPVVPGSKALCHRAFGASDCAAAVMLDTPKPTSSTSSPQQPSTSPASTHGSMATFGHKRDSQDSPPWSQMPHEVNGGK